MCQTAVHTTQRKGSQQADRGSSLKLYRSSDPTRTLTLRRRYAREMRKRFRALRGLIRTAIVGRDVFGLSGQNNKLVAHQDIPRSQAFDFPRTQDKVSEFMEWLEQQVDAEILEVTDRRRIGQSIDQTWQNVYIEDTYKRGVQRATYEMDNAGFQIPDIEARGGIGTVLSQPAHVDRLGVLYTRAFNELKGITDDMGQKISRVLAQGLADGDGPRLLARKLNSTISGKGLGDLGIRDSLGRFIPAERRAQILARTETIRAHHKGTMQTYRNWGAEGVKVKAEFRTAGDQRVCPECAILEGSIFKLKEAENLIPVHPMCRCIVLPARPEDISDETQVERGLSQDLNREVRDEYNDYKEGYDQFFEGLDVDNSGNLSQAVMDSIEFKMRSDMPNAVNALNKWKRSATSDPAMAMKAWAQKLEGKTGDILTNVEWTASDISGLLNNIDDILPRSEYLRMRAFNQAFMDASGINSRVVYRGMSGGDVRDIYANVARLKQGDMARTKFSLPENPITGYSTEKEVADAFAKLNFEGVRLTQKVNKSDIIFDESLFRTIIPERFLDEFEILIRSGVREFDLEDILLID